MVLKVSVTPDIDSFYVNIDGKKKNYDFTVCRGLLSFYDDDSISIFKLTYSLNDRLNGEEIDITKIDVSKKKAQCLTPIRTYKYEITFPENLAIGMYNLTFQKSNPPGTHQMKIMMLPSQFRNNLLYLQFKHQHLELIDDTFLKSISICNNKLKSILLPEETNKDDSDDENNYDDNSNDEDDNLLNYFKNIINCFYQNMTSAKAYEYLSCLGLITCTNKTNYNIIAVSNKIFYCIINENSETTNENENENKISIDYNQLKIFSEKTIKNTNCDAISIDIDDIDFSNILNNTKTNFTVKNIKKVDHSADYFIFNDEQIYFTI